MAGGWEQADLDFNVARPPPQRADLVPWSSLLLFTVDDRKGSLFGDEPNRAHDRSGPVQQHRKVEAPQEGGGSCGTGVICRQRLVAVIRAISDLGGRTTGTWRYS